MGATLQRQMLALGILLVACFAVAGLGGLATAPNVPGWYSHLAKPSWTPPSWVFGPVWSVLYLSMAVSAWLVWRQGNAAVPMTLFGAQLAFNLAWSWLFFALHSPLAAFADIVLLWLAIAATTVVFWRRSPPAGILLTPYLLWVTFAAVLNFAVWRLNG
jgi:translocator protein